MVTAAAGMDILCHALESYTARWYADFDAKQPEQRVPYCGANPIADLWSEKALTLLAGAFRSGGATTARTPSPASRWRWPRRSPGSASATPGCTSRTPTPTRSRAGSGRYVPVRLPGGRADRAARHGGLPDRARGVPVHLRRRRRSGTCAPPGCSTLTSTGNGPGRPARASSRALMRGHRHPQRPRRGRVRRRATSPTWSPARSSSSGCWPRHRGRPRRRTSPGSSARRWNTGEVTATPDLVQELRRRGVADVDDSTLTRALYSSDASLYRVVPQVVVRPRSTDEVIAVLDASLDARRARHDARRRHLDRRQRGRPWHRRRHRQAPRQRALDRPRGPDRRRPAGHRARQPAAGGGAVRPALRAGPVDPSRAARSAG